MENLSEKNIDNLIGKKVNNLTVVKVSGAKKNGRVAVDCLCDCTALSLISMNNRSSVDLDCFGGNHKT